MKKHPTLMLVPSSFLDSFEKLLKTAPPPRTAQDKADRATAKRILSGRRARRVEVLDENDLAWMVAKKRAALRKKAGARKKRR